MNQPKSLDIMGVLRGQISQRGSLGLDEFMSLALGHPEFGYYMARDPLGAQGDFTTAPEISQIFGEMIGAWMMDVWAQMGRPSEFILLELGPGRGTLMADILRAGKTLSGFVEAAKIHLVETSPALVEKQKSALAGFDVRWHGALESVPKDRPILFIANEFFDALPVKQYIYKSAWHERVVVLEGGVLAFSEIPVSEDPAYGLHFPPPTESKVLELAPMREAYLRDLSARVQTQGGAGLVVDYGHTHRGFGDTFQALHKHQYSEPLENIGQSDLTSHVDFAALAVAAEETGCEIYGPIKQGDFLKALGIEMRTSHLLQNADEKQAQSLQKALHRLTHWDEMGSLFKVMGIGDKDNAKRIHPAGF